MLAKSTNSALSFPFVNLDLQEPLLLRQRGLSCVRHRWAGSMHMTSLSMQTVGVRLDPLTKQTLQQLLAVVNEEGKLIGLLSRANVVKAVLDLQKGQ